MKYLSKKILLLSLALIPALISLSGCNLIRRESNPEVIGRLYGFEKKLVKGGAFQITTYQKITDKSRPYVFYIEGDGMAFKGKYKVSDNPTPRHKVLMKLASMDKRPNVVYVARPCQYTDMKLNPKCDSSYWTSKRLSDDSVESINQVINRLNTNNAKFSLVGYSGGGGIAVLIAARNPMVQDIITISGTLDHKAFTKHHNVSPMIGSLNPIDYVAEISDIPQLHLSGGKDDRIPPFIADEFVTASESYCVKHKIFSSNSHSSGWEDVWEYVLTLPLTCFE